MFFSKEIKSINHKLNKLIFTVYHGIFYVLRTGTYRQFFHPEQLISGKEDVAINFV
jgi:hypothetical protein